MFVLHSFVFCLFIIGNSADPLPQCKINDIKCLEKFWWGMYERFLTGDPSLDIESVSTLFFKRIDGDLSGLNFTLTDTTVKGLDNCRLSNLRHTNPLAFRFDLNCAAFTMNVVGKYAITGRFFSWIIADDGTFDVTPGSVTVKTYIGLEETERNNGKAYLKIKTFKTDVDIKSVFKARFENLFKGDKKLSDAIHKFAHDNWKLTADYVQKPLVYPVFKRLSINLNKLLRKWPFNI